MPWTIERKHDHVAVVTMNTNKVNAQNSTFFDDLHAAFDRLEAEFNDYAIVLTGTGGAFSAGLDSTTTPLVRATIAERDRRLVRRLSCHQPAPLHVSSAYRGGDQRPCIAGGLITALGRDHRIASDGAPQFSLNEVAIGIPMPAVYCEIIKHAIGPRAANELTLFGQIYDLVAAARMGVIDKTALPGRLLDDAVAWAALVPPDCYPAYAFAKRALQATTMAAIDAAARLDRDWLSRRMSESCEPARPCASLSRTEGP
jgi:enoyl-CoA hydratase